MKDWQFLSSQLAIRVIERLRGLNVSPAYIANKTSLTPAEVFNCLSGVRDFTLEDIAKLEIALEAELLIVKRPYES